MLPPTAAAADALSPAVEAIASDSFELALERLREAFEAGYPTPADVYEDPRFSPLRENADARGPWRDLMGDFVEQSEVTMVSADEAGTSMLVRGLVIRTSDREPVAGAVVHLYHTDDTGEYEPNRPVGDGSNPRLFAWVRTDSQGRFAVRTIKPREYPGASPRAAHVHFRLNAEGYRKLSDVFRPYTQPADEEEREAAVRRGRPVSVVRKDGDRLVCEVVIPLTP
jgi:hypothetical protein